MKSTYNFTYDFEKNWIQDNTFGKVKAHYCVDSKHYITKPNWDICEICNGVIKK